MRLVPTVATGFLFFLFQLPSLVSAQSPSELRIAAGISRSSVPEVKEGFNLLAAAQLRTLVPHAALRLDASYESTQNFVFGSANVVISPFRGSVAPYLIGGLGTAASNARRELVPNWGVGTTLRMGGHRMFLEARQTLHDEIGVFTLSIGPRF